jgi:hypothetical protein
MAHQKQVIVKSTARGLNATFISASEYFDRGFTDGVYAIPTDTGIKYNVRAIDKYCAEHNLKPSDLTEEQLKQFQIKS